ncbi:MAG: hypothetical protein JNJ57_09460 [Saprospiraceae bacterium]|nr:hypothetical protein [Saprospiraceae bacterium]
MIEIRRQPAQLIYEPQTVRTRWFRLNNGQTCMYLIEPIEVEFAGWRNRELSEQQTTAEVRMTLLESGALLASFPFQSKLPGSLLTDPFTVWFQLDAPAIIPEGLLGKAINIAAGKHLTTQSLDSWMVFFRPHKT